MSVIRLLGQKIYTASTYLQVSTTEFGMRQWSMRSILKEPQYGSISKQIESTLNCENPLV